jgi:hypothetical protein
MAYNDIDIQNSPNILIIKDTDGNQVIVTQDVTRVVEINTPGPKGDKGDTPDTLGFLTTSSFVAFTSSYYQDSSSFNASIASISSSYTLTSSFNSFTSSVLVDSGSVSSRLTTNESNFTSLSGSFRSGSFSGSFNGDGSNLTNIPASGIIGLNLSQIASGSATASISPVTGFVINTNTNITGSLNVSGSISSPLFTGTDSRVIVADPSGSLQTTSQVIIDAYIDPNGAIAGLLNTTSNWSIYGEYTGTPITDTFQGQRHYNIDYFFEAINDNDWIRLIRG